MPRLNFLNDEPWDEVHDDLQFRTRWFGHPLGADRLGASLRELLPGSPGGWLHMHYVVEEMFFVLGGRPTLRTGKGEEQLSPGDVVCCPEGIGGLHTFSNPTDEPVRILAVSTKRFPRRRLSGVGDRVGGDTPPGAPRVPGRRQGDHRSLRVAERGVSQRTRRLARRPARA